MTPIEMFRNEALKTLRTTGIAVGERPVGERRKGHHEQRHAQHQSAGCDIANLERDQRNPAARRRGCTEERPGGLPTHFRCENMVADSRSSSAWTKGCHRGNP